MCSFYVNFDFRLKFRLQKTQQNYFSHRQNYKALFLFLEFSFVNFRTQLLISNTKTENKAKFACCKRIANETLLKSLRIKSTLTTEPTALKYYYFEINSIITFNEIFLYMFR